MASERIPPRQWDANWPPDDTEESIMGSDWHQLTIFNLRLGINEIAHAEAGPERPVPFQALTQTTLLGLQRRSRTAMRAMPDVFIYKKPMDGRRLSFSVLQDGPPVVAIEVASGSTFQKDADFASGKGWIYAAAGIVEYLTIDTSGFLQEPPIRAWRLRDGSFVESTLDGGVWWSEEVPIGIAVRDGMVVVYDRFHRPQPRESEIGQELMRREISGHTAGLIEGSQQSLIRVLQHRFDVLPESLAARIASIDNPAVLDIVFDIALDAHSLAEFEQRLP